VAAGERGRDEVGNDDQSGGEYRRPWSADRSSILPFSHDVEVVTVSGQDHPIDEEAEEEDVGDRQVLFSLDRPRELGVVCSCGGNRGKRQFRTGPR